MPERYLGTTLGRFRIQAVAGSGGFAWVYRGYDPELDIPVAVKVLKPQFAGDQVFETRFRGEASTAAKLRHPNIIRILGVGRQGDAVYFAMDYLPHGLADRLAALRVLPEPMVIRVGIDVSRALAFAHREGVIHRDIKVDNILFDDHGNAIVADFGIARAVSGYANQTGTNMVVGTPQYFSPEQARGLALDGRADIYSLGVTLFRAATGSLPFTGDDWYEIARQHVEQAPPKPRALNPSLSRDMERVILTCLEKDPADRYPTGEALCEELLDLQARAGEASGARTLVLPSVASDAGPAKRRGSRRRLLRRKARRLAMRGAFATGAVALLAAALVVGTSRERSNAAERERPSPAPDTVTAPPALVLAPPDAADSAGTVTSGDSTPPDRSSSGTTATGGAVGRSGASAPRRELRVSAPHDAELVVDGDTVGRGEWRSTAVAPGVHVIKAILDTAESCPWARDSTTARVGRTGVRAVQLAPRACGYLSLDDVQPAPAQYTVASATSDTLRRSGTLPLGQALTLPIGLYTLRVSAPYCSDFTVDSIEIEAGVTKPERIRLFCIEPDR